MPYTLNVFTGEFDYYRGIVIGSTPIAGGTTGSVLFIGASGEIAQDNTNFFWDDTDNILKISKLHIGATSATLYPFNLDAAPALSGTSYLAANFIATYTPSANFSESVTGFFAQTTLPLGGFNATGTIAGGFGSVRITGSGTVNIAAGFRGVVTNVNTAVVTEGQSYRASIAGNLSTGSIATLSSFYSPDQTAGTSNIGFNGNISSGSNKWNLYMGGTAINYMAGALGIGSSAPVSMLTVGATNGMSSKLVTVSDVTTPTSAAGASGISVVLQGGGGIYMKDNGNGVEGKFEAYGGAMGIGTMTTHALGLWADNGEKMTILAGGNVGIGNTSPAAVLHIKAGTATASTAPLKLTSGTFNTTAEAGAMEYNNVFALTESDATRRYIVQAASSTKTTAGAPYANDGYITARINGVDVKLMTTA